MVKDGAKGMVLYGMDAGQEDGERRCGEDGVIWYGCGMARWRIKGRQEGKRHGGRKEKGRCGGWSASKQRMEQL